MFKIDENEKLIEIFRRHPLYIIFEFVTILILAILPLVLFIMFDSVISGSVLKINYLYLFLYFIYLSGLWILGFVSWTNYYLDMWILTDKRLISVDQAGLFSRQISSLRLDRIQDVKVEVFGFIDTIFHIGTIHVQTAGAEKEFVIYNASYPNKVREKILSAHNSQIDSIKTVRLES